MQRSAEAIDTDRTLKTTPAVTGSDVISFDFPLRPLPEVGATRRQVAQQPEVEFFGSVIRQTTVRDFNNEERLTQSRRTLATLVTFSLIILIYLLLTSLTQSLSCQRTGVLVLVIWVTWLLPAALIWISDIQSRLRCICYCHVTCCRSRL